MKFIISTQELNFLVNKIQNIVPAKPTVPLLGNVLIRASQGRLTLTATDLTIGIECSTSAKVIEEGSTTLPAKKLAQLLKELTAVNLEVSTNANHVTEIVADSSRFKLNGMSEQQFPTLPDMSTAGKVAIPQSVLQDALYRTSFAVSREDNRFALTGVCMQVAEGWTMFVGTDGKKLSRICIPIPAESTSFGQYVIPLKSVEEIVKNLTNEGEVYLYLMSDKIAIEANDTLIVSKLLTGEYPDVNRVIPEVASLNVTLHREELISLLRQLSPFVSDANHSARFSFSTGELKLTANTSEVGEGKVSMPVNYQGERLDVAFNPGFYLDILRHCKEETVTMGLIDAYNPGIIADQDSLPQVSKVTGPLFILMPMRLQEE